LIIYKLQIVTAIFSLPLTYLSYLNGSQVPTQHNYVTQICICIAYKDSLQNS